MNKYKTITDQAFLVIFCMVTGTAESKSLHNLRVAHLQVINAFVFQATLSSEVHTYCSK